MKLEIKKIMSSRLFGELIRSEEPGFKVRLEYLNWYERLRNNFDDFIKQKIELWMFVPCKFVDGVWVVLEEPPKNVDENNVGWQIEYQEAKNRVLFQGFQIEQHEEKSFSVRCENNILNVMWNHSDERNWFPARGIFTVEDLVKYNLELNPTAQKQIGL